MESDEPTVLSYTKHLVLQIFITFHILDLRFLHPSCSEPTRSVQLSELCLFCTGCSRWLCLTLNSGLGACSFSALMGASEQEEAAAWAGSTAGAWAEKLQFLAGLTLHPIPSGHRNSERAVERRVGVSWRGMAGADGCMISHIFPFTSVGFNTWFSFSSSQKMLHFHLL